MAKRPALDMRELRAYYDTPAGTAKAVDGVTLTVDPGERFGLVGESGSGKSTIAMAAMRLLRPPARIEGGQVWVGDVDMMGASEDEVRRLRLAKVALVAQGSINALNPVARVRAQLLDGARDHGVRFNRREADSFVADLLEQVGLHAEVANSFPHQLSGGMKQRVCIAIAVCLRPEVIIADEPTSALDVVVQRQVMESLRAVQASLGAAVLLIGHDIGLMAQVVHRLGVMYAGRLVEVCGIREACREPLHPYTRLLVGSVPNLTTKEDFGGIPGLPPSLVIDQPGCPFRERCPEAMERCATEAPVLRTVRPGRQVACHLY